MIIAQTSTRRRHGLDKRDDLYEVVFYLALSKKPAFQRMNNLLNSCLDKRHHSKKYIKWWYQKHGLLLPLLMKRMYTSFFNLYWPFGNWPTIAQAKACYNTLQREICIWATAPSSRSSWCYKYIPAPRYKESGFGARGLARLCGRRACRPREIPGIRL
jgi:hypothetical protein